MNGLPADEVDRTRRPAARLALTLIVIAGLIAALTALGGKKLPAPPLTHPSDLSSWANSLGTAAAALSIVRLLALAVGWYVAVATFLHLLAALVHIRVVSAAAKFVTLPPVRRTLMTIAGIGLTAAAPALATARRPPPPAATASGEVGARPGTVMRRLPTSPGAVMHRLGNDDSTASLHVVRPGEPDTATLRIVPPGTPAPAPVWTVQSGDDFWHIAASILTQHWGRAPSDTEIDPYWQQLIERNRGRLADPTNPDLLFPGQVLSLPTPPPPPG